MINFERLEKEKIAVLFDTKEDLHDFLEECEKNNILWCNGVKATVSGNTFWDDFCITIGFSEDKRLERADQDYYESVGYQVVNYKNLIKKFTKADLKDGDILTDRDGCISVYRNNKICGGTIGLYGLDDNLMSTNNKENNDIIKVERPVKYETVFEREEEPTELTTSEIKEKFGITGKLIIKEDE